MLRARRYGTPSVFGGAKEVTHTALYSYQRDVKQKSREPEMEGEIKEGGEREERITCPTSRSIGSVFR